MEPPFLHLPPSNSTLLPKSKLDEQAIENLHTLPPYIWTPLLLYTEPAPSKSILSPFIDSSGGLLTWIQDLNWPVAKPTLSLLLSLVNSDQEVRERCGTVLIFHIRVLLHESEDWEWLYNILAYVVAAIEDRVWARIQLADALNTFADKINYAVESEKRVDKAYGFSEVLAEILGKHQLDRQTQEN
jgi:hypothetical protein